ncbi:MAG: OmpA family protein [candidate division Zixibacteria bacterium]|nr:OmpA family protein [candidate division Zixibacteria bacterium]
MNSSKAMARIKVGVFLALTAICLTGKAMAYTEADVKGLTMLQDSLVVAKAPVFAPKAYKKSRRQYDEVMKLLKMSASASRIDKALIKSREFGENALRSVAVTREALREYLEPREKALKADAPRLQSALFNKGEKIFVKATEKIEKGDIKGGLKEVTKSVPHFDRAEQEAIRSSVIAQADLLILRAINDEAKKFALITLDKARTHRNRASGIIDRDRYDLKSANAEAALAEYEARHATEIAQRVRSLKKNDQAWEQIMLSYELIMQKAADARELKLAFDKGILFAAEQLANEMKLLIEKIDAQESDRNSRAERIAQICSKLGINFSESDGADAALTSLEAEFQTLVRELDETKSEMRVTARTLEKTKQENEVASAILAAKEKEELKFIETKALFKPTEALVLYNASQDIVIRLRGLSFESGSWVIENRHIELLEKVAKALKISVGDQIIIEGHTDNTGSSEMNRQLSEKRALAVMNYLRQSTDRAASEFRAIGYGAEKPVANNQNEKGRSENRRIDIVILD